MRNFIIGVVVTLLVLLLGGLASTRFGFLDTTAEARPGALETYLASAALDSSVERNAPRQANPVPETDDNLLAGMMVYANDCALCHGKLNKKESPLGQAFSPPAPQLITHPLDDPEPEIFYLVKHGVRWTGMPAWSTTLDDESIWKVTSFLRRINNLPPAVQQQMPPPASGAGQ